MRPIISTRLVHLAAIALALTVAACGGGGGGGGGSTPPVGSPPGGPPPGGGSPSPTASPTSHPTSTPTATPTPVQTATPPPATRGITMLPDTSGRFGLTQIFDWDGFASHPMMSTAQIQAEAPHEDSIWGAFEPATWNASHPGMIVSRYMLPVEDDNSVSGYDLNWWQTNHPDWILYACKADGTPTKDLAWGTAHFPDVPLNFANPDVVDYQIKQQLIPYMKKNGYNAIAADNTDLLNYLIGGNPNFGQTPDNTEYGCGTYDASGNFTHVFNGGGSKDQAFIAAMVNWVQTARADLHAAGLKLIINHPLYNQPTDPNESQLLNGIDGMVYERGFTDYGKYQTEAASLLGSALTWAQYTQTHGIAFLVTDYLCSKTNGVEPWNNNAPCSANPADLPAPQVDWSLATYALINDGGADVYISPETGNNYSYRPEYATAYGAPCGNYTQTGSFYQRKFNGALVLVNASTSAVTVPLPSNHHYADIEGRAVSGSSLTVAPADGYVLLTTNGCT